MRRRKEKDRRDRHHYQQYETPNMTHIHFGYSRRIPVMMQKMQMCFSNPAKIPSLCELN
ncbi:MAG TPA: hypothetical protein VII23_25180 [Terriglobales bacterium]